MRTRGRARWLAGCLWGAAGAAGFAGPGAAPPLSPPPVGIEPAGIRFWRSGVVFKDAFKHARPWRILPEAKAPGAAKDPHGWVRRLPEGARAESRLFHHAGGHYPGGDYLCTYEGNGRLRFAGDARVTERGPGRIRLHVDPSHEGIHLILERTDPTNHLRDLTLWMPGVDRSAADPPFHPRFLELLEGFRVIRFAGLMNVTDSGHETWADRARPADATQGAPDGMALEYAIALCNTLDADAWFCMPHRLSDAAIAEFAKLVRRELDPQRHIYVEYAHDVGFWSTPPARYCREQGNTRGLAPDGDSNQAGARFYAERAMQTFLIWRSVFRDPARLTCVLGHMDGHEDYRWRGVWRLADAYAVPHLFGARAGRPEEAEATASRSVSNTLDRMAKRLAAPPPPERAALLKAVRAHGLRPISFYLSQTLFADPRIQDPALKAEVAAKMEACLRHPRMRDLYRRHIANWEAMGGGLWIHPYFVQQATPRGHWGLLESIDQPADSSPRFRAVREALRRHREDPRVPLPKPAPLPPRPVRDGAIPGAPLMGRISAHLGARLDFDGYGDGTRPVSFEPLSTPARSVWWHPLYLKGDPSRPYTVAHLLRTPDHWVQRETAFRPDRAGAIRLRLTGAAARRHPDASYQTGDLWPVLAEYDDVRIEGAELSNPGFENPPRGDSHSGWVLKPNWKGPQAFQLEDSARAGEGRAFAVAPSDGGWEQDVRIHRTGTPVRLAYRTRLQPIEPRFQLRIGFDGWDAKTPVGFEDVAIPRKALFWRIDPVYWNWGLPERLGKTRHRMAFLGTAWGPWRRLTLAFTPDADGSVALLLHGVRALDPDTGRLSPRWLDIDRIRVTGADIPNGSFEAWTDGTPDGWKRYGRDRHSPLRLAGIPVVHGERAVRVWYESAVRTRLTGLEAGRRVRITLWVRAPGAVPLPNHPPHAILTGTEAASARLHRAAYRAP